DGRWCTVGTMNFDNRSLAFNDETILTMYDEGMARRLEEIFEEDLKYSREITLANYPDFPLWQRAAGRVFFSFRRML
ncbi:MAG TPA: phospholipase D-like domain-containing protein, partial [Gemmatimonadaceae bacterium]|nr:phospholipase D-like domain-containing protein [Gemmatimonadaceae bacterium]